MQGLIMVSLLVPSFCKVGDKTLSKGLEQARATGEEGRMRTWVSEPQPRALLLRLHQEAAETFF